MSHKARRRCSSIFCAVTVLFVAAQATLAADPKPWYTTDIGDDKTSLNINIRGSEQNLYTESHALLIGEVNYINRPPLTSVPRELVNLTKALERQHFKVELYFDLKSEDLEQAVDDFMRHRGTVTDSRLFVYISSHGESRDEGQPLGYILPVDAPNDKAAKNEMSSKALSMQMFSAWAQFPDPKHMMFVFDSCFSGAFFGYRGLSVSPPAISGVPSEKNTGGITIGQDGQLVTPPPERSGIESSNYALEGEPLTRGRQFLSAGDSNETVPGTSLVAQLLTKILDDQIPKVQLNADYWTSGDEIGIWMQHNVKSLIGALLNVDSPPSPVFGRLPFDSLYTRGDILFSRLDLPGGPAVKNPADEILWNKAIARNIDVNPILTNESVQKEQAAKAITAEYFEKAEVFSKKADELQAKADVSPDTYSDFSLRAASKRAEADDAKLAAEQASKDASSARAQQIKILSDANALADKINGVVATVIPPENARLSPDDESQLRGLIIVSHRITRPIDINLASIWKSLSHRCLVRNRTRPCIFCLPTLVRKAIDFRWACRRRWVSNQTDWSFKTRMDCWRSWKRR
ncbi:MULTISPECIES: caspase family protein [Rhizobium/Agrobacterium group]|nr:MULTISPECIES: caspase family protein [Rhizobium/Agrobacterium group]